MNDAAASTGVFLLDPDEAFGEAVARHCARNGLEARIFRAAGPFFIALDSYQPRCIILESELEDGCGLDIQASLALQGYRIPLIFAARQADTATVVRAMKGGAHDFLVKPVAMETLCEQVRAALEATCPPDAGEDKKQQLSRRMLALTAREQEVLALALTGRANKDISRRLGISPRTVEAHRARVLEKIGLNNLLELAHIFVDLGARPFADPEGHDGANP